MPPNWPALNAIFFITVHLVLLLPPNFPLVLLEPHLELLGELVRHAPVRLGLLPDVRRARGGDVAPFSHPLAKLAGSGKLAREPPAPPLFLPLLCPRPHHDAGLDVLGLRPPHSPGRGAEVVRPDVHDRPRPPSVREDRLAVPHGPVLSRAGLRRGVTFLVGEVDRDGVGHRKRPSVEENPVPNGRVEVPPRLHAHRPQVAKEPVHVKVLPRRPPARPEHPQPQHGVQ
mmetsp:Transcript_31068/g.61580  ORF Transcript_31068/g.61580 Transcript_31068/m.61580 type:complete len:228 (-) Transcript_31068:871-1554(-)